MKNLTLILAVLLAFYSCKKDDDKDKEPEKSTYSKKITVDDFAPDHATDIYLRDNTLFFVGGTYHGVGNRRGFVGAVGSDGNTRFVTKDFAISLPYLSQIVALKDGSLMVLGGHDSDNKYSVLYRMDGKGELISTGAYPYEVAERSSSFPEAYPRHFKRMALTPDGSLLFAYDLEYTTPASEHLYESVVFFTDPNLKVQKSVAIPESWRADAGLISGDKVVVLYTTDPGSSSSKREFRIYDNNMSLIARKAIDFYDDSRLVSGPDHDFFYIVASGKISKFDGAGNEIYTVTNDLKPSLPGVSSDPLSDDALVSSDGGLVISGRDGLFDEKAALVKYDGASGSQVWKSNSDDISVPAFYAQLPNGDFMGLGGSANDVYVIRLTSDGKD